MAARSSGTWALVAGGGTAGHVLPAVAVARALVAGGCAAGSIHFVGASRGIEARLVPASGFEVTLLPGRGVARRLSADNLGAVAGTALAVARAVALVGRRRPAVVLSVGGYASVPAVLAAALWRVPVVVAEQNAVPGLANRLAGRLAAACAVSFPGTPLPRAVVTGNPVRPELAHLDRSDAARLRAREALGWATAGHLVAVVGGSLGSRRINLATVAVAGAWRDRPAVSIHHVVGERDAAEMAERAAAAGLDPSRYRQVSFEERMDLLLAAADVVVGRAGAGTVFELAAAGRPSLLVPLPGAPGDHQGFNARYLSGVGASVVVADGQLDGETLGAELDRLLSDPDRLAAMGDAAATLAVPDAADRVARLVEAHARA